MDDDKYTAHRLELVYDELKAIHELVAEVPRMARKLDDVAEDVAELKQAAQFDRNMAVRTDREVDDLKRRVSRLEAA